jgi:hypothetical protein
MHGLSMNEPLPARFKRTEEGGAWLCPCCKKHLAATGYCLMAFDAGTGKRREWQPVEPHRINAARRALSEDEQIVSTVTLNDGYTLSQQGKHQGKYVKPKEPRAWVKSAEGRAYHGTLQRKLAEAEAKAQVHGDYSYRNIIAATLRNLEDSGKPEAERTRDTVKEWRLARLVELGVKTAENWP